MRLWLVRHAQPLVEQGVCYGALDVAADPLATRAAATALARELPPGLSVWVSALQRCGQLAQQLQLLRPDLSFTTDTRLAEMNFGTWEGVRWDAIAQAELQRWTQNFGEHRFGGTESANDVLRRVAALWAQSHQVAMNKGGHAVWITHAGVVRAAQLLSQGCLSVNDAAQWPLSAPAYGQWSVIAPWQRLNKDEAGVQN
jgi:alpha-ribazole phosphatase